MTYHAIGVITLINYDFLIIGAGLYGAVCAYELSNAGYECLVLEKRDEIGGNLRCETDKETGISIHKYGPHVFHTDSRELWDYMEQFDEFIPYNPEIIAYSQYSQYNLPFNLHTVYQIYGVISPEAAKKAIKNDSINYTNPSNLESYCLSTVGARIYKILIKEYTEKQWGKPCRELPAEIIKRLPVRLTYDNRYFSDRYSGVPSTDYNTIIEKMLENCSVCTGVDFLEDKTYWMRQARHTIFTGEIDRFYNYKLGHLEYRSLRFEKEIKNTDNYQGGAIRNYIDKQYPWTRIVEYKHFKNTPSERTVLVKEFPEKYTGENEPYYPVNDVKNNKLYENYLKLNKNPNLHFGGRLGLYQYNNMDKTVELARELSRKLIEMVG